MLDSLNPDYRIHTTLNIFHLEIFLCHPLIHPYLYSSLHPRDHPTATNPLVSWLQNNLLKVHKIFLLNVFLYYYIFATMSHGVSVIFFDDKNKVSDLIFFFFWGGESNFLFFEQYSDNHFIGIGSKFDKIIIKKLRCIPYFYLIYFILI